VYFRRAAVALKEKRGKVLLMRFSDKNDDKTIFAGILEAALHRFGLFNGKAECS